MNSTRILILDDELGITRLCEKLLRKEKYEVVSFTHPHQALEYLNKEFSDLLLVDIRMPEMSGFDVITAVKELHPDMAILVMTGFGTVETAIHALKQGVDGLILKPFENSDELIQAVKQALVDCQNKRDIARIQALRPLFDLSESFFSETQPGRLLELILNAISGHLRSDHVGYFQYLDDNNEIKMIKGRGIVLPEGTQKHASDILKKVFDSGSPLWVNTIGSGDNAMKNHLKENGLCSVMCAPALHLKTRAVFYVGRVLGENVFREVDWETFLLLSRQASVAMENADLYAELREYVRQIEESQQALIRAEKMTAAGRMTASIAHEINNPLQAMHNCLHLSTSEELDVEKRWEYINLAKTELDRLMATMKRMLGFFRPGSMEPKRTDLTELLQHVIGLLTAQMDERNIKIKTKGISKKIPTILAVSSQIQQVFLNLILNAYDAMPSGGELWIEVKQLHKDLIEITFQDTGPGISAEDRKNLFEPFVSKKDGGTGLGLSVSYGIVTAHGGSLDLINPENGRGACFRVTLPVRGEA